MEARLYQITGRVQGVGFRYFTQQAARSHGIIGWVRNRYDGSVEVLAQGSRLELDTLEQALRRGPAMSHVDRISYSERAPDPALKGFRVTL